MHPKWVIRRMNNSPREVAQRLLEADERIDTLSNDFIIMQPDGHGYRYSTDDMLVAWFALRLLRNNPVDRFIDLGSGLGSVPMILLACMPQLCGVGVEILEEKVSLCNRSLISNRMDKRFALSHGDLRDFIPPESFEKVPFISSSPPYFPEDGGVVPDDRMRAVSMFELHGNIGDYIRFAAEHLGENGLFVTVYPTQFIDKIEMYAQQYHIEFVGKTAVFLSEKKKSVITLVALGRAAAREFVADIPDSLIVRNSAGEYTQEYIEARKVCGFTEPSRNRRGVNQF